MAEVLEATVFLKDHLGSTRMVLGAHSGGGCQINRAMMYQPFGSVSEVEGVGATSTDPLRQKFTTKEFDEEGVFSNDADIDVVFTIKIPSGNYAGKFTLLHSGGSNGALFVITGNEQIGYTLTRKIHCDRENVSTGIINSVEIEIKNTETNELTNYKLSNANWNFEISYIKTYKLDATLEEIIAANSSGENLFDGKIDYIGNSRIDAYHFGARVYEPEIGIWLSTDPAAQFFNRYGYHTNPILYVDPNGETFVQPLAQMGLGILMSGLQYASNPANYSSELGDGFVYALLRGAASGILKYGTNYFLGNILPTIPTDNPALPIFVNGGLEIAMHGVGTMLIDARIQRMRYGEVDWVQAALSGSVAAAWTFTDVLINGAIVNEGSLVLMNIEKT